jgi:hypothetical protein
VASCCGSTATCYGGYVCNRTVIGEICMHIHRTDGIRMSALVYPLNPTGQIKYAWQA